MMDQVIIYIHGQGGNVDEAKHYEALFENQKVIGIDFKSETPWEAAEEFSKLYNDIAGEYKSVILRGFHHYARSLLYFYTYYYV